MTRARADYELAATDKTGAAFASVDRRLETARQSIQRIGLAGVALGGAASAGLAAYTKRLIEQGDAIHKATVRTGIQAEELSAFHQVANLSNVDAEAFNEVIFRMNKNLGQATEGVKAKNRALEVLNLDLSELLKMNVADRFFAIADALNKTGDDSVFAAHGQELFGRGIRTLLPLIRSGRNYLEEYTAALAENPIWTQDQANAAAAAADSFAVLSDALQREQNKALPALAGYAQAGADLAADVLPAVGTAGEALMTLLGTPFAMAAAAFDDSASAMDVLKESAVDLGRAFGAMDEVDQANRDLNKLIDTAAKADAAFAAAGKTIAEDFFDPLSIGLDAVSLTPGAGTPEARDPGGVAAVVRQAMQMLGAGPGMMEGAAGSIGQFGQVDRNRFVAGADALARPQKVEDPEQRRVLEEIRDILRQNGASDTRTAVFA